MNSIINYTVQYIHHVIIMMPLVLRLFPYVNIIMKTEIFLKESYHNNELRLASNVVATCHTVLHIVKNNSVFKTISCKKIH